MNGLAGKTVRIDLDTKKIDISNTDEKFARDWIGARGFVSKILYDEVPRDADAYSKENRFIIAPGILTGTFQPSGSKCGFGAISPLSNGHADASMGGHFGPEIKFAGYDLIVFKGISDGPTYLFIDDDKIELRDASKYWGKGALDCEKMLKDDLGEDFEIITIGPAGENLIRYSCISHDFGRQAGRCGVGSVMGSKKIKAVAVRGTKSLHVKDIIAMKETTYGIINKTKDHPNMEPWQKYGTAMFIEWSNKNGVYPTKNFSTTYFDDYDKIDGEELVEKCLICDKACFGCWMNCGKYSKATVPGKPEVHVEGPEYETGALCGGNCGIKNIHEVAYANWVLDNLGMDTISGGSAVAFGMECYEKGILTKDDFDGHELRWGNIDDFENFANLIAYRKKIGDLFAEGTKRASEKIGQGTEKFAIQVKGVDMSGYDGRWAPAMLLSFMTADVGAHHNRSWTITMDMDMGREKVDDKAKYVVYLQHIRPFFDTVSVCRLFWGELDVMPEDIIEAINQVTDWNYTVDEAMRLSDKIWNINRAHYLERNGGPGRKFDYPPARFYEEPVPTGPAKGAALTYDQLELMLDQYYEARGWDKDGNPSREILEDLDLKYIADNLEKLKLLGKSVNIPPVRGERYKPKAF